MTSINTGTSMNDTSSLRSRTVNKTENGTTIVSGNDNSDKDLFLKLLVAQMKNQDPFNSQSMALNENIEYLIGMTNGILANSAVGSATNLIGKEVEVYAPIESGQRVDEDVKTISGKVENIHIKDGVVYMNVKDSQSENIIEVEYGALIKVNG